MQSLVLALGLFACLGSPDPAGDGETRPNVLWLTVEDMSPWIPCYGDDTVSTPNLDRLAGQSVRFTNAFATSPVCAPARSSLITGMYATRIGTLHMRTGNPSQAALEKDPAAYGGIPSYQGVPPAFVRCFPEELRAAGYYCTNAAKTDYQFRAPVTVWDASGGKAHWRDRTEGQPFFAVFNHGGTHESRAFPDVKAAPRLVAPDGLRIPPLYPDTPAVREALARTYDNIAAMDAWVGRKLDELEAAGLADSTIVFFFSDHGVGLPRGKRSPYDLGTRVPLLVRIPEALRRAAARGGADDEPRAGRIDPRVVSFVDFGPTVLSLAGIAPEPRLDGRAFLGPHAADDPRAHRHAFAHADRFDAVYDRARSVSDGRWRYVRNYDTDVPHLIANSYRERLPMTADLYALRGAEDLGPLWQVGSTERPAEELYDSASDPWETDNLLAMPRHGAAGEPRIQEIAARLRSALDAWIEDTGDLGLVLPEKRMVAEHLWPDLEQPVTAAPIVTRAESTLVLECPTPGAALGWRQGDGPWWVYSGPIPLDALGPGPIEVEAHRIGFAPTRVEHPTPR